MLTNQSNKADLFSIIYDLADKLIKESPKRKINEDEILKDSSLIPQSIVMLAKEGKISKLYRKKLNGLILRDNHGTFYDSQERKDFINRNCRYMPQFKYHWNRKEGQ